MGCNETKSKLQREERVINVISEALQRSTKPLRERGKNKHHNGVKTNERKSEKALNGVEKPMRESERTEKRNS